MTALRAPEVSPEITVNVSVLIVFRCARRTTTVIGGKTPDSHQTSFALSKPQRESHNR